MYGYSEAEALSKNIVDTVPTEYQEEARGFLPLLNAENCCLNLETKRKHKDGRILDVWLINTKLTDDKGKLTGIATTERDITERKHSEASLREKARELEFLREGKSLFLIRCERTGCFTIRAKCFESSSSIFEMLRWELFIMLLKKRPQAREWLCILKTCDKEKTIVFGEGLIGQAALEKHPILLEKVPSHYFGKISSD